MVRIAHLAAATLLACACSLDGAGQAALALEDGTPEADGVLAMINDAGTTLTVLDIDASLNKRAATNIINHRNGADGLFGSADDDIIDTIVELDAISYVGDSAIQSLYDYAVTTGWVEPDADVIGVWDDVPFSAAEIDAVLSLVNSVREPTLDVEVGLDSRAARNIVAAQPLASMDELSACGYVGKTAMQKLKAYAIDNGYGDGGESAEPVAVSITALVMDAEANGTNSEYYGHRVTISRAMVTSGPSSSSTGSVWFYVADPWVGNTAQLKVYIPASAGFDTSFLSIFDDVSLTATFTNYNSSLQLQLDDPSLHALALRKSGLAYDGYATVQAAWHSTSANPEGVVRVVSSYGYTYMVPLPIFLDHPMWGGNPPAPPRDSGNEQDHAWNSAAQQALDAWL